MPTVSPCLTVNEMLFNAFSSAVLNEKSTLSKHTAVAQVVLTPSCIVGSVSKTALTRSILAAAFVKITITLAKTIIESKICVI